LRRERSPLSGVHLLSIVLDAALELGESVTVFVSDNGGATGRVCATRYTWRTPTRGKR